MAEPAAPGIARPTGSPAIAPPPTGDGDGQFLVGAAGIGVGIALIGSAALARRELRRRFRAAATSRRDRRAEASTDRESAGDDDKPPPAFASAELARPFAYRAHGGEVEPAVVVARHAARLLAEEKLADATVLLASQEGRAVTLTLAAPAVDHQRLAALAPVLGARLGGKGGGGIAARTSAGDLEVRLLGLTAAGLLSPPGGGADGLAHQPALVPLAALPSGAALFANWDALGHILVAGLAGDGSDAVLGGLVAQLASRLSPADLYLLAIASRRALPDALFDLPHWRGEPIEPGEPEPVEALLDDLHGELLRRRRESPVVAGLPWPDLVLVIGEAADLDLDGVAGTGLESLGREGPAYGIRLLAATTRPADLDPALLAHFATRLTLRLEDAEDGVRLVGLPGAARLDPGELMAQIAGRQLFHGSGAASPRLRAFRLDADELARFAQLARTADGAMSSTRANAEEHGASHDAATRDCLEDTGAGADAEARSFAADSPACPPSHPDSAPRQEQESSAEGAAVQMADVDGSATAPAGGSDAGGRRPEARALAQAENPDSRTATAQAEFSAQNGNEAMPESPATSGEPVVDVARSADRAPALNESNGHREGANEHLGVLLVPARVPETKPTQASGDPVQLEVRCFGRFEVRYGDQPLSPRGQQKAWELLVLLASSPPEPIGRERLHASLWPQYDPHESKNRLSVLLKRLRDTVLAQAPGLSPDFVRHGRDGSCWLDPALVRSDVHRFLALAAQASKLPTLDEALAAYREADGLYDDNVLRDAPYAWVDARDDGLDLPESYQATWRDLTAAVAARSAREGRSDLALPLYRRLVAADPTREEYARALFRCHGATGDRQALLRDERAFRTALRQVYADPESPDEDDTLCEPEPETQDTFRAILEKLTASAPCARVGP